MSSALETPSTSMVRERTSMVRESVPDLSRYTDWILILGLFEIGAGIIAVSYAFSSTIISMATLGVLFLVVSGAQTAAAIMASTWRGFFLFLAMAAIYCGAGLYLLVEPVAAAESLTLLLTFVFIAGGAYRISVSMVERFPNWGWGVADGIITLTLGMVILSQWPVAGAWVPGTLVGIHLVTSGVALSMLATGVRNVFASAA